MAATARAPATRAAQTFPADRHSRDLFVRQDAAASITNVWAIEIVPGRLLAYELRRPGRFFRAEFDLSRPRRAAAAVGQALNRCPEVDGRPRKLTAGEDILTHLTVPIRVLDVDDRCRKLTMLTG